jgi:hypothetical protein
MAVREKRWEVAALYLLVAVLEAAGQVPRDALPGLLEALEGERAGEG